MAPPLDLAIWWVGFSFRRARPRHGRASLPPTRDSRRTNGSVRRPGCCACAVETLGARSLSQLPRTRKHVGRFRPVLGDQLRIECDVHVLVPKRRHLRRSIDFGEAEHRLDVDDFGVCVERGTQADCAVGPSGLSIGTTAESRRASSRPRFGTVSFRTGCTPADPERSFRCIAAHSAAVPRPTTCSRSSSVPAPNQAPPASCPCSRP